jgi:TfoX/Sxy family transcriptional regulator of competence genes
MTTEEKRVDNLRAYLASVGQITEVETFGGDSFMLNGNMIAAASKRGCCFASARTAVGIDMHLDPRLDEVRAHRALRDLQLQRSVGRAIVVADLPLLLHAQDLVEIDARDRREGRALAPKRALWAGR